ncbi:MAG: site-specific integrase, partial [Muribaculaceae bacterium]|nr:site-specific integrase [Muribaculaceae bacterium]
MKTLKFNLRFFLKPNNRVFLRIRWNGGKNETSTALNVFANPSKWDAEKQRARINTTHEIQGKTYSARLINREIDGAIDIISSFFAFCEKENIIPTLSQVKEELTKLNPTPNDSTTSPKEIPPMKDLFESFKSELRKEKNWSDRTHCPYQQIWTQLTTLQKMRNGIPFSKMDKRFMTDFKSWLLGMEYKNSTISRRFRCLKTIFTWLKEQGYEVCDDIFSYKSNLSVPLKNVIYLLHEEVQRFECYNFPSNKNYLAKARDLFCFMCYTSLRYSDLKNLKRAFITNDCIDMYAQKTKGKLKIPLVNGAKRIMQKYKENPGENVFPVPSSQKLNEYIREAAKIAGLDREVITTTFCGTKRIEKVVKLHEAM